MNHAEARQLEDGSGWHWTRNGHAAAPCRMHVGDKSDPFWYTKPSKPGDWSLCEPHATKEEAERHFYNYSLEQVEETGISWTSCQVSGCPAPANRALGTRGLSLYFSLTPLCPEHLTRETLTELYPFTSGISLMHS